MIPDWFDYGKVSGLSREMNEKLTRVRPRTLGQASRIPGVTPAAVSLINVYIEIQGRQQAARVRVVKEVNLARLRAWITQTAFMNPRNYPLALFTIHSKKSPPKQAVLRRATSQQDARIQSCYFCLAMIMLEILSIGRRGDDFLGLQVSLGVIGTSVNDLLRVDVTDARQRS